MSKVADIKLKWTKSPSADIAKAVITVTINGTETTAELPAEVQEFMIVVPANGAFQFQVDTYDSEGLMSSSVIFSTTIGDLVNPLPATGLGFEIVGVRDVEDVPSP